METEINDYHQARLNRLDRNSAAAHRALGALEWLTDHNNMDAFNRQLLEKLLRQIRDNLAEGLR